MLLRARNRVCERRSDWWLVLGGLGLPVFGRDVESDHFVALTRCRGSFRGKRGGIEVAGGVVLLSFHKPLFGEQLQLISEAFLLAKHL